MHHFRHDVFVLRNATGAAVKHVGQILLAQSFECAGNFVFRVCSDRVAIVLLVAGEGQ